MSGWSWAVAILLVLDRQGESLDLLQGRS